MGRPPRPFVPEGIYHLNAHGIDDRPIFVDDADRQAFALRLRRVALREGWALYAVCLMDTHYHLVVQPSREVSDGMKVLNGAHSRAFNKRHARRGARVIRYVEQNPVEAGMVRDAGDWPWST